MVRQIPPMSQAVPGAASSTILLSSPAGTQIVNAGSLTQPGMLQASDPLGHVVVLVMDDGVFPYSFIS